MRAMRGMLIVVRLAGVIGLACACYAWLHPAQVKAWMKVDTVATTPVLVPVAPPPPPAEASEPPAPPLPPVAVWLGTKYHVAPEAIAPLVDEAADLESKYRLTPHLLMAVMAIESSFHPYTQSDAGAQGLMQVMPHIHARRYEKFGGKNSFINPIVSLDVGAEVLHDAQRQHGGAETEALRFYFGGGPASDAYIEKVRAEQKNLVRVARGDKVPFD